MPLLADLVAMYVITGLLLIALAALLGKADMPDSAVSIGIIVTYIISCFAGGFLIGKKKKTKKYLWGLCMGACYFAVLFLGNLAVNRGLDGHIAHMLTTLYAFRHGRRDGQLRYNVRADWLSYP